MLEVSKDTGTDVLKAGRDYQDWGTGEVLR